MCLAYSLNKPAVIPSGAAQRRSRGILGLLARGPFVGTIAIPRLRVRFARAPLGMTIAPSALRSE